MSLESLLTSDLLSAHGGWQERLDFVVEMMRDLSRQTDPQVMVANYGQRMRKHVWMSNLFGRATHSLVLSDQVKQAYEQVDRELRAVADIQRSLLPSELPRIAGLDLASHYQTSTRSGGDYYDFFELPEGKWGILIADVSGHGTPAAVIMAVTHSIAHMLSEPPMPPSTLMHFVNRHLTARYTNGSG